MRICVFCSGSDAALDRYGEAAREAGRAIGARGYSLVYGGTAVGLMGDLAAAARDAGAHVTGVISTMLVERGIADEGCDELIVTEGMGQRKVEMFSRADAFLALPGGLGTLDELLEAVTLRQLGVHAKPIALYGPTGFWDPFTELVARLHKRKMCLAPEELALTTDDLDAALGHLEAGRVEPQAIWRA